MCERRFRMNKISQKFIRAILLLFFGCGFLLSAGFAQAADVPVTAKIEPIQKTDRILILAPHPDDETIWMGGMILSAENFDWTIFSLCRADDSDRAPKFKKVCEYYNARGVISDLEDEGIMDVSASLPEIKKRLAAEFAGQKFDYIYTHGKNGEYGHERHLAVNLAVKELIKGKIISCRKLRFFAYRLKGKTIVNSEAANFALELDGPTFINKKNLIENIYKFNKNSFESLSCLKKETFIEQVVL